MAYDVNARKLAIKVIGTVESNLDYSAVNFNDPITVGVAQWYGTRAATILEGMRTTNAGEWYGVEPSLGNQLATIAPSNTFWNSRYLTAVEGNTLSGVLSRNQALQNTQLDEDLEGYKDVAISYGFNPDTNTNTVIYFYSMHHQGPAYALEVVQTLDTAATLDQIHAACLTHPVLGQYGARYNTTYNLIMASDTSGVDPVTPPTPEPTQTNGNARLIQQQGDLLLLQFSDSEKIIFYPNGSGRWLPRKAKDDPLPPTPVDPPPPAGTGVWVHPAPGTTITSPYGPRGWDGVGSFHWGVDLSSTSAPRGVNIIAVTDLVVTRAFNANTGGNATAGGYIKGHTIDGSYTFCYYHMAPDSVIPSAGDTIAVGSVIGVEGQTGNVTGTHLHFEAYEGVHDDPWAPPYGNPIEPLAILRAHGISI